jgi:hypothetical protein
VADGTLVRVSDIRKEQLHAYLARAREAVIWKTEGLSEYDVRRPLTASGTNLRGLVKHLAVGEAWYLGQTFGRPFMPHLPSWDDDAPEGADLWATAAESRGEILGLYRAAIAHGDETIRSLDLDAPGHVPWWSRPDVTLHGILVHLLAETSRHAGHADVLREQLDGRTGLHETDLNKPAHDEQWWAEHRSRIEDAARDASST